MTYGFFSLPFKVATSDGRNFILLEPVDYVAADGTKYRMPAGADSDGASTPPILWEKFDEEWIPPFGSFWPAAYLHDCAYRDTLLRQNEAGEWVQASLSEADSNNLLKEAMEVLGTHHLTTEEIYQGVVYGGKSSFDADRAAAAAKRNKI
jgi:hypothetical protein